jgi:multidrug efflux pump subunit AcrB
VRQAFYGEEAQRLQRNRDDVKVMVRYPPDRRRSMHDLHDLRIRTRDGFEVPFAEVAAVEEGRGYASIRRVDGRRSVNITADVDTSRIEPNKLIARLEEKDLPELAAEYPGLQHSFQGARQEQELTLSSMFRAFIVAMVMIYALLAIPFKSYIQPFIVMAAIPFGLIGAVLGHLIMGMELTVLSMFGVVALTGVVVNDSLVMVDFVNRNRPKHTHIIDAVRVSGVARFRAIMLTSLTTFAGLTPLVFFEKSVQAQFLIPMAVSIGFGVMFATLVTLVLVPSLYMILEDIRASWQWLYGSTDAEPEKA